jgi:hypothetical protein
MTEPEELSRRRCQARLAPKIQQQLEPTVKAVDSMGGLQPAPLHACTRYT